MLTDARLDIRIKEDITDEVYAIITGSWAHFLSSLKGKRVDKDTSAAIDTAVELWTRRTRAIDAGALRICRFHALKKERSEEHTSELQSLMRLSYAVFCLNKKQHKSQVQ